MTLTNLEIEKQTKIAACIEAMNACNKCYVSSLKEYDLVSLCESMKYNKEAAEICSFAAAALSRGTVFEQEILALVIKACEQCANESEKFEHTHCQSSAEACRRCAEICSIVSMAV